VMYSQVPKYELNGIYHFIEAMYYIFNSFLTFLTNLAFLNAVYFCAFLFLFNFPYTFFSN